MQIIYTLFILLFLCSCKSKEEKIRDELTKAIRQNIEDVAFKNNQKVKLLEISSLSFSEVGQRSIDTIRYIHTIGVFTALGKKAEALYDVANTRIKLARLYKDAGMSRSLYLEKANEAQKFVDERAVVNDSMDIYKKEIDQLGIKMKAGSSDPKNYYKTKALIKATIGEQNTLDTVYCYFDKKYKFILSE